jgi:hypothetical protein
MNATRHTVLVSLLMLLMAPAVLGQEVSGLQVVASSGIAFPAAPMTFAESWNMQAGGSVGVGVPLSSMATLVGSLEYYRFELDVEGVRARFDTDRLRRTWVVDAVAMDPSAGPSSVLTVALGVRLQPRRPGAAVEPYVVAGGGWMRFSLDDVELPTTTQFTAGSSVINMTAEQSIVGGVASVAFVQTGLGASIRVAESLRPFVEARYVIGFTSGARSAYVPLTIGVIVEW